MATSGLVYSAYGNHSRFYLAWQVASQDIANNRSLINWQVGLEIQAGGWYWGSNSVKIYSINIDGSGSLGSGTWSGISGTGQHQLKSGSMWISHAADGTKSFSANLSGWLYGEGNKPASGSWSIPTIPRNSQVTASATSYTLGDAVVINTNRKSSSFTHTITIRMDNASGTVLQTINSVADSTTWTPTSDQITTMQNHIPNSNTLSLYIDQYNNQVKASSNVTVTLNLTEANPTFTTFTYKDSDTTTAGITGNDQVLVKGKSVLEVDISAANKMTAIKGASADHYSIAYDGSSELENYSASATVSASFATIATIGTRTIQVTAYDSRNNATKVSQDVIVYDYAAPVITTTLTRENNFGDNTTVHIEGTYTPLNIGGTNKNSLQTSTLQYRYQEEGGAFGSWVTKTFTANTTAGTFTVTDFVVSLDNTKKYNFEFHVDDKFGTVTTTNSVDVGTPIMFVGQNGGTAAVGINKMPTNGALDIDGDIYANGNKLLGSVDEDDMVSNSSSLVPTQQSAKAYVDANKVYYGALTGGAYNTSSSGGYTVRALATPCAVTVPVISGKKYIVTASCTYFSASSGTGELDFGPGVGTTPVVAGTYGANTNGSYGYPVTTRAVYTATSTGNVTFQVIVASASATTIRTDNPCITVQRVY